MSLPVDLHSHRTQLVLTALGAAAVSASAVTAYNAYTRRQKRRSLNHDIKRSLELQTSFAGSGSGAGSHSLRRPSDAPFPGSAKGKGKLSGLEEGEEEEGGGEIELGGYEYDEELVREQLARNYAFFGEEGMKKVRGSSVVIVGCGGVGSWAAVMLCRSCVSMSFSCSLHFHLLFSYIFHLMKMLISSCITCVLLALQRSLKNSTHRLRLRHPLLAQPTCDRVFGGRRHAESVLRRARIEEDGEVCGCGCEDRALEGGRERGEIARGCGLGRWCVLVLPQICILCLEEKYAHET